METPISGVEFIEVPVYLWCFVTVHIIIDKTQDMMKNEKISKYPVSYTLGQQFPRSKP